MSVHRLRIVSRWIAALGMLALAVTMPSYRSHQPSYFQRWSAGWLVVMALSWALALLFAFQAIRPGMRTPPRSTILFQLAAGLWGLVYSMEVWLQADNDLVSAWTNGHVFIAVTIPGVVGEWVVMALTSVATCIGFAAVIKRLTRWPRFQIVGGRCGLIAGGFLLAALAAEGIVRAKNLILPTPQAIEQAQAFRIFKWRNYRRNEQGFRDDPIMSPKATNTYRVLCIGDSYTEGWGIAREEDRLTEIMQKQLVAPPPIAARVEVLNAGIAGAHTASQADALDDLLALQPDYVLLIYCFNDIDHAKSGAGTTSRRSKWSPSYLIRSNFHCGMETYARARDILYRYENEKSLATAYDDPLIMSAHLERLVTIFDTCKQHKVPAVLVPFDHSITLGPRYLKRHDTLVSAAATAGINVWRTDHLYGERAFRDLVVSSLDAHPNEQAHRLMGVELARRLRESLKTD